MELSKTCEYCGKVFYHRHTQQSPKSFLTRKYCCLECANRAQAKKRAANKVEKHKEIKWAYPKKCLQCGEEFWPREYDSRPQFARRKYCSHECAYEARRTDTKYVKTCLFCGKTYEKRRNENISEFYERKYCSHECARAARYKKTIKPKPRYNKTKKPHSFKIYVNNM